MCAAKGSQFFVMFVCIIYVHVCVMCTRWQASTGSILTEFSLGPYSSVTWRTCWCPTTYTVVNGEKGHSRQLTVQVLQY